MIRTVLLLALSITCLPLLNGHHPATENAILEITFTGLRNGKGQMVMGISNSPKGWPRNAIREAIWKKTNGDKDYLTVRLENLAYGEYALSVLDDENSNGDMDSFLGVPQEGYGFTRDPKVRMSAPDYEECVITVDRPLVRVEIPIHYIQKSKD